MLTKIKFKHILHPIHSINLLFYYKHRIPLNIFLINFFFQKFLRINSEFSHSVHFTSQIIAGKGITLGKNVYVSLAVSGNCYIQGGNGILIDDDVIFAPGVKIISANHNPLEKMAWKSARPIKIGKRCWIGSNAVILPEVELGDDCIVGAGSVVTNDFASGSVIGGIPARLIKLRPPL